MTNWTWTDTVPKHERVVSIDVALGSDAEWQRAECQRAIIRLMCAVGNRRIRFYGFEDYDVNRGPIVHYKARPVADTPREPTR